MRHPRLREQDILTTATLNFKAEDSEAKTFYNLDDFEGCIGWSIDITGAGAANATVKYRKGEATSTLQTLAPNGADWSYSGIANLAGVREFEIEAVSGAIVVNLSGLTE